MDMGLEFGTVHLWDYGCKIAQGHTYWTNFNCHVEDYSDKKENEKKKNVKKTVGLTIHLLSQNTFQLIG